MTAADPAAPGSRHDAVDAGALRAAMRTFATGVTVVTSHHEGADFGMTVNSLTSVSLDPPLVLVCLVRGTRTLRAVRGSGRFGVTILRADQASASSHFARPAGDRFADLDLDRDEHGLAVLSTGLAHLRCTVHDIHDGGDHEIVVGRVSQATVRGGDALIFHDGRLIAADDHAQEHVR